MVTRRGFLGIAVSWMVLTVWPMKVMARVVVEAGRERWFPGRIRPVDPAAWEGPSKWAG